MDKLVYEAFRKLQKKSISYELPGIEWQRGVSRGDVPKRRSRNHRSF